MTLSATHRGERVEAYIDVENDLCVGCAAGIGMIEIVEREIGEAQAGRRTLRDRRRSMR